MHIAKVANYYGLGEKRSEHNNPDRYLDTIELIVDDVPVRIIQNHDAINTKPRHTCLEYTTRIETNEPIEAKEFKEIVENICLLLKFASMSQVVPFEYSSDGINFSAESVMGACIRSRPVLEIYDGANVRNFIELTWLKFKEHKKARKLNAIIDMLSIAEELGQVLEVRLAIVFMLLESLKSTYAKSSGLEFVKGKFRNTHPPYSGDPKNADGYSFKELLNEMLCSVGMKRNVSSIIKLRNDIFHSAISEQPHEEQRKTYEDCQDLAREYLLRLLEYHGQSFTYKSRCIEVIHT